MKIQSFRRPCFVWRDRCDARATPGCIVNWAMTENTLAFGAVEIATSAAALYDDHATLVSFMVLTSTRRLAYRY